MKRAIVSALWFVALVSTVAAANAATSRFGVVTFLGVSTLAGTYCAGAALVLRDGVHESGGRLLATAAVCTGALVSWAVATPALAVASGVTFLVAELSDLLVYDRLHARSATLAVLASGAVGAPIDTLLFLHLAGFPITWPIVEGQLFVKLGLTALAALLLFVVRRRRA